MKAARLWSLLRFPGVRVAAPRMPAPRLPAPRLPAPQMPAPPMPALLMAVALLAAVLAAAPAAMLVAAFAPSEAVAAARAVTLDHTITAGAGPHGLIAPSGAVTVADSADQAFAITADPGYRIDSVYVDDTSVGPLPAYTFTTVTADHSIFAAFLRTFTLTASAGANGSISPSGATVVDSGGSQHYGITPDPGYRVAKVSVDGDSVAADTGYTFTGVAADHSINATFALVTYTITASAGANGTVTPSGTQIVNGGDSLTIGITPNVGYRVSDVTVDGVSAGPVTVYTFRNVAANHVLSATFARVTYTITASAAANGSIAPPGVTAVDSAGSQAYTITPAANYHVADVLVDGISVGAVTGYTFNAVSASHTISASFARTVYTITATAGANGSISPSGATPVNSGDSQLFTLMPGANYRVADVVVDGTSVGAVPTYTFNNVTANHTISVSFVRITYTITATSGANGSVSPVGTTVVNAGADQGYTITPSSCYHVLDVTVDGNSVGPVLTYNFHNVVSNHAITATFARNTYTITTNAGANGTITPTGPRAVSCGDSARFTITPSAGYHIASLTADGVSKPVASVYTFTSVGANHSLAATFAFTQLTYTITASAGPNGTISPAGSTVVNAGDSLQYSIIPSPGYRVADVLVDGGSVGDTTRYIFRNVNAPHTISATFAQITFTITATAGPNGSIAPTGSVILAPGANQAYTITPNAGYRVEDVRIDGATIGPVTGYTFTNVTSSHTISATFTRLTFTVTATAAAHGSVTPSGAQVVNWGDSLTIGITPDAGYYVSDVTVDGVSVGAVTRYVFYDVTAGHTLAASFARRTYTVTASAGPNGSITPSGATVVDSAGAVSYTITPALGYRVASVLVDGLSVGGVSGYTFTDVVSDHAISATFSRLTYVISASAGDNGVLAPGGDTVVGWGDSLRYTITPDERYHIAEVLVDGVSVGPVPAYTFRNVTANHLISATFALTVLPPAAPTGLVATAVRYDHVHVEWNAVSGATRYLLFRNVALLDLLTPLPLPSDLSLSYEDRDLPAGSVFYYRVFAARDSLRSGSSNLDSAATPLAQAGYQTAARTFLGFTLPLRAADNSVAAWLHDDLGAPDSTRWRLGRWSATEGRYLEPGRGLDSLRLGEGYWLITNEPTTLHKFGLPAADAHEFRVPLEGGAAGGWNQMGNPFLDSIPVADLHVDSAGISMPIVSPDNHWTEQAVRVWQNGAFLTYDLARATSSIPPLGTFWVKKLGQGDVRLVVLRNAPPMPVDTLLSHPWKVEVTAAQGASHAEPLVLGAANVPAGRWNALDLSRVPAPPEGALALSIPHSGWGTRNGDYVRDFRPESDSMVWDFEISGAAAPGEVNLHVQPQDLPQGALLLLWDPATGIRVNAADGLDYRLAAASGTRRLRLVALLGAAAASAAQDDGGSGAFSERAISVPNPFAERVGLQFRIARPSGIHVAIYDAAGRLVRRLDREMAGAGENVLVWDGLDTEGHPVASGVFFARYQAGSLRGGMRLLKIR